jgi:hypothetical protein
VRDIRGFSGAASAHRSSDGARDRHDRHQRRELRNEAFTVGGGECGVGAAPEPAAHDEVPAVGSDGKLHRRAEASSGVDDISTSR